MSTCLFCGEETDWQKYCSKACATKFRDHRRSEFNRIAREKRIAGMVVVCHICNEKIDNPLPRQKTHSGDCRQKSIVKYRQLRHRKTQDEKPVYEKQCYCGRVFTTRLSTRILCREPECLSRYIRDKTRANYQKNSLNQKKYHQKIKIEKELLADEEEQTLVCKCIGCGCTFEHTFYPAFIGNGMPRLRCKNYPGCMSTGNGENYFLRSPDMAWESQNRAMV